MKNEVKIRDERFTKVNERLEKMRKRQYEFAQTRSKFQIEKFIACDEYSPITKYRHLANNSYVLLEKVKNLLIERERITRQIKRKEDRQVDIKLNRIKPTEKTQDIDLDIYQLQCRLESIEIDIKGTLDEIEIFEELCDKLEKENGKPFTYEDFEKDQPNYWKIRLANKLHNSKASRLLNITEGLYNTYMMAREEPLLEDSNQIEPLPLDSSVESFNELAIKALENRPGLIEK